MGKKKHEVSTFQGIIKSIFKSENDLTEGHSKLSVNERARSYVSEKNDCAPVYQIIRVQNVLNAHCAIVSTIEMY